MALYWPRAGAMASPMPFPPGKMSHSFISPPAWAAAVTAAGTVYAQWADTNEPVQGTEQWRHITQLAWGMISSWG